MPGGRLNHTPNRPDLVNIRHLRVVYIHRLRTIQHSLRLGLTAHYLRRNALTQLAQEIRIGPASLLRGLAARQV